MSIKRINLTAERRKRAVALKEFRKAFCATRSPQIRLSLLKEIASKKWTVRRRNTPRKLAKLRNKFNLHKGYYYNVNGPCKVCNRPARVRHHIIQLQNGGSNSGDNLLRLCEECHAEIHPWLKIPTSLKRNESGDSVLADALSNQSASDDHGGSQISATVLPMQEVNKLAG